MINNHFKSKSCSGASGLDEDQGDGQRGEAVMEAYRDDVTSSEEASRDLVIDMGSLRGR